MADNRADGEIVVGLDVSQSTQLMQSQLDEISKKLNLKVVGKLDSEIKQELSKLQNQQLNVRVNSGNSANEIKNVENSIKSAQNQSQGFGQAIKNAFNFGGAAAVAVKTMQLIRKATKEAVDAVKDFDSAITDLRTATGQNYETVKEWVNGYNKMGQALGATTSEVADSANTWLRQGRDITETNQLIETTMMLSKVGMLDSADAAEYLTSAMKGYKIAVDDVAGIVDKLTNVDAHAAVSAGDLAEAMSQTAVTAADAGISMDKLLGYLATVGEVTQRSMSSIGNAFKTIFTRMSDIKSGNLELIDEDGTTETLSDVETVLNNANIKLRESENEFRNFGEVIDEVASKWDSYSDVQQAAIAKAFAGTRQQENFRVLMANYDKANEYMNVAANSAGSAEKKFSAYLDSIEAKTKSLQAAFESLAVNTMNTEVFGGIIDATTGLVKFLNATGLVKASLISLGAAGVIKGFTAIATGISAATIRMNEFNAALKLIKAGNLGTDTFQQLVTLTSQLSDAQLKAILSSKALSTEQRLTILTTRGMSDAEAQAALSSMGLATAEGTATAATFSLSAAFNTLKAAVMANPILAAVTAATVAVVGITQAQKAIKQATAEAQQATKEAAQAHLDAANSIDEYKTKIKELRDELDSGNLSEEDAYEKRKQLISIQDELVDKIGNEAKAFNILKDSLDDVNSALDQYTGKEANNLLSENRNAFDTAVKEMKKVRNLGNGMDNTIANRSFISLPENKEIYEQVQQIFNDVFGNAVNFKELGDGRIAYELKVDAKTAADGLAEVNSQMYNLDKELSRDHRSLNEVLGLDSFDQSWENAITVAKKEAQAVLDEFSDNYDNMVQLKIQAEYEVDNSIVPEVVSEIDKIKESYETAIKEGNDEAAKQAYENMQEMVPKIGEIEDEDIADYLSGVVDAFNENAKKFNFEIELKAKLADDKNAVSRMVKNAVNQFKTENGNFDRNAFVTAQYNYQNRQNPTVSNADERAYVDLKKAADDYNMSVEKLIDTLEELGYMQSDNADIANEASDSVMSLADTVNSLADAEKNIKGLSEVFNEFNEKGAASVSSLSELSETFGNLSSYNDFIKVMSDSATTAEEAKAAWSQLAQEYINSLDVLDNVTASNMGVIESFLNQMGVVNAHEVVMSSLSAVQLEAIVAANGLADATWEETNKFLEQEGVAESTREALRQYRIERKRPIFCVFPRKKPAHEGWRKL